jgi:Protein of unknown function (DUF998)
MTRAWRHGVTVFVPSCWAPPAVHRRAPRALRTDQCAPLLSAARVNDGNLETALHRIVYGPRREQMRTKATIAVGLCVAFLTILSVLHVLEPEFNPPHFISEYQLGRFGWLMSFAFFCLGAASLALFAAARQEIHTRPGRIGIWGLLVTGVAYFCAGIFPPDPKWFVGSVLHGIGGLVVIFGSPIVFTLVSKGFARNEASSTAPRPLLWTAILTWLSLVLFYGSSVAFRGPPRSGSIVVGWTNRILITTFVLWFLVAAFHVRSIRR